MTAPDLWEVSSNKGERAMSNKQRKRKATPKNAEPEIADTFLKVVTEGSGQVLYLNHEGRRIAKRSPGKRWRYLVPGYKVSGGEPGDKGELTIIYEGGRLQ